MVKNFLSLTLIAALIAAGGWAIYFGAYYKDYFTMQEVTESVVLSWGAYNKTRAEAEIGTQLRRREIDYITPEHCDFREEATERVFDCAWQVDVYAPLIGGRRLDFATEARIDAQGELIRY